MWSICKKDIEQFFSSLIGYIAIFLFLVLNGLFLFVLPDSNILDFGYASLDRFFDLTPWVFLILVPAITMRSLSEEYRLGTFELLKTSPLKAGDIVLGKFFSVLIILLLAILPTVIYAITIQMLSESGSIDTGAVMGSYFGLFLLGATFASIGLCCSSFTANAVVAFLLSAFICVLLYFGFNALSRIPVFSGTIDYYIEMVGIDFHFRSMSRGVVDTRGVTYFLSCIVLMLFITKKNIDNR